MDACGVSLCVPGLLLLPEQQPGATPGSECGDGLETPDVTFPPCGSVIQAVAQLREKVVASGCLELLLLKGTLWLWQLSMKSEKPSDSGFHSFLG